MGDRIERQNLVWTEYQIADFQNSVDVVAIFLHAYPHMAMQTYPINWEGFIEVAESLASPFLLLQGDAHCWLED